MTDLGKKWGSSAIHKTQSETSKSSLPRRQEPGIFLVSKPKCFRKELDNMNLLFEKNIFWTQIWPSDFYKSLEYMSRILKLILWWFDNWKPDRELSCSFISPIVSISEFLTDIPKICRGQKVKFKCKFFSNMSGSFLLTFILSVTYFVKVF